MHENVTELSIASERDLLEAISSSRKLASALRLSDRDAALFATAVSELATNILRYAGEGSLRLEPLSGPHDHGLRVVARDDGPGIADIAAALEEGVSAGRGLGLGLPAVRRFMDEFRIESAPGRGVTVTAVKRATVPPGEVTCSVAVRPLIDLPRCGDTVVVRHLPVSSYLAIVDVLGHGSEAHELALTIESCLDGRTWDDPAGMLAEIDAGIRGSRGACIGLASFNRATGDVRFAGIGNVVARILGRYGRELVCRSGIVGHTMPAPRNESATLSIGDVLLLCTDGVREHVAPGEWHGLHGVLDRKRAAEVIRRLGKGTDDAASVAMRYVR